MQQWSRELKREFAQAAGQRIGTRCTKEQTIEYVQLATGSAGQQCDDAWRVLLNQFLAVAVTAVLRHPSAWTLDAADQVGLAQLALVTAVRTYTVTRQAALTTWIFQCTRTVMSAQFAKQRITCVGDTADGMIVDVATTREQGPLAQLVYKETVEDPARWQVLHRAVRLLPRTQREAIQAGLLRGKTGAEVARSRGTTREAVRQAKVAALHTLRKSLRPYYDPVDCSLWSGAFVA